MNDLRRILVSIVLLGSCGPASRNAEDLDPLFRTLEAGSAAEAMSADERLSAAYDDTHLARLEQALETAPARTLHLIGSLPTPGSALLLLNRLPYLLESADAETARMAAVAAGLRRLKKATTPLLQHFEQPSVLRALGRIWLQPLEAPPLPRAEEIDRLTVLAVVHRLAMGSGSSAESCEAMFSVMTETELSDFLSKHAGDPFPARHFCDEAVRRPGFDADKGLRVHEALLSSPDVALVAAILETSPFPLAESRVRSFLGDGRGVPGGLRLGDAAARRLNR